MWLVPRSSHAWPQRHRPMVRKYSSKLNGLCPFQSADDDFYPGGQPNNTVASNSTDTHHEQVEHGADDTVPWQLLFWAQAGLAVTGMSQPSFVNRYVYERIIYVARGSPFISLADGLDLFIRIAFAYRKLPFRHAIAFARDTFETAPSRTPRKSDGRSILYTWLLFFLTVVG